MKIRILRFILTILILISGSCVKLPYLVCFNNTDHEIDVILSKKEKKKRFLIKRKDKFKLLYPSYADKIEISFAIYSKKMAYKMVWPPEIFIQENFMDKEIFFQLEPNGYIYILKDGDFPAKEFPPQPEGYPLKPIPDTENLQPVSK